MRQRFLPLGSLLCAFKSTHCAFSDHVEPHTQKKFLQTPRSGSDYNLVGCGARFKYGIVPVYAIALYAPRLDALCGLNAIKKNPIEFQLVLTRKINKETFLKAISDQLLTRVSSHSTTDVLTFIKMCRKFPDNLLIDSEIGIQIEPGGKITVYFDGVVSGFMFSPEVALALSDIYFDDNTVSPTFKNNILANLK